MKKALEDIGMHKEMVELIRNIQHYDVEAVAPNVIAYMNTLTANQVIVFWATIKAVNVEISTQLYNNHRGVSDLILKAFTGNKELSIILYLSKEDMVKRYEEALS